MESGDGRAALPTTAGLTPQNGKILSWSTGFTYMFVINSDSRGEIGIILLNAGNAPFVVTRDMRIAQAVLAPVLRAVWQKVEILDATQRGIGGFGSTGVHATAPIHEIATPSKPDTL